jgi:uncharacterized protein YjbI with pentapeptide repeats
LFETKLIQFRSRGKPPIISLRFADLRETPLGRRSILSNTDLDRADLTKAKLPNANLSNANLPKADLPEADLREANLREASLSGADLREAEGLTQQQIDAAMGDQKTQLPAHLKRPALWSLPIEEQIKRLPPIEESN